MNRPAAMYFSKRFYGFVYFTDEVSFGLTEISSAA